MKNELNRFDLKGKLYQKSAFEKLHALKEGELVYPLVIDFDVTTNCNLKCRHCISKDLLHKKEFSKEKLLSLANEFIEIGVKSIILTGGGEPLLNSNISDFILALKQGGIKIGLVSNGILLSKYIETLKLLDWIRISVDAASDSTYYNLKLVHKFDDIISGLKLLNMHKKCAVGFSFLVLNNEGGTNIHEIYQAAVLAKEIGCDYFELKNSFDMSHHNNMPSDEHLSILLDQLTKIKDLEDETFKVYSNYNIENITMHNGKVEQKCDKCYVSNLRTVVSPSGVYFCSYLRGDKNKCIGDVNEHSFVDVWKSTFKHKIYNSTNPNLYCNFQCARTNSNIEIQKILNNLPDACGITISDDYDLFI